MQIIDIVDEDALKHGHLLKLPPFRMLCPECGERQEIRDLHFIKSVGYCRHCSDIPAIVRKYQGGK